MEMNAFAKQQARNKISFNISARQHLCILAVSELHTMTTVAMRLNNNILEFRDSWRIAVF